MDYRSFLDTRQQTIRDGIADPDIPSWLYPFQRDLVRWALERGRAAIFADCGLGKTPMQLAWADAIARHTGKPVLIATPLAVSYQAVEEAHKFHVEAHRSTDGTIPGRVVITNYERLDRFEVTRFGGMVCDESSILKNFNGQRKALITDMMRRLPYRLLCTATAAPNDYTELGTSSEALGELGYMDMLSRYFKNDRNVMTSRGRAFGKAMDWRLKRHAEGPFWQWVSSWARAIRRPSDYGYKDGAFQLPTLTEREHIVDARTPQPGMLFDLPAVTLADQRAERRRTIAERCDRVAELVGHNDHALVWCHLNAEGEALARRIPDAVEVSGSDSDEVKESRLMAFARGDERVLITKPKIGAWGLNLQRCAHVTFFPSHSYEQYYQGVRRCWRFGQSRPVVVDIVATEGERRVIANLHDKATRADRMFESLMEHMRGAMQVARSDYTETHPNPVEVPPWL